MSVARVPDALGRDWRTIAVQIRGEWTNLPAAPVSRDAALAQQALGHVEVRHDMRSGGRVVMLVRRA